MKSLKFWKNWKSEWIVMWLCSAFAFIVFAIAALQVESFGDKLVCWMGAIGFPSIMPLVFYFGGGGSSTKKGDKVTTANK